MANPYMWVDDIAKKGWLPRLSGHAVKLVWAVGLFWNRSTRDARTDAPTLRQISGLARSSFYEALAELRQCGLIHTEKGTRKGKYREYRITVFRLVVPISPVPVEYQSANPNTYRRRHRRKEASGSADHEPPNTEMHRRARRTKLSVPADDCIRQGGLPSPRIPRRERRSTTSSPTDSPYTVRERVHRAVSRMLPQTSSESVSLVIRWAEVICRSGGFKDQRRQEAIAEIGRRASLAATDISTVLEQSMAMLHPTVQAAIGLFNADVVEIRRIHA